MSLNFITDKAVFNIKVESWGKGTNAELISSAKALKKGSPKEKLPDDYISLIKSLKDKYGRIDGEIMRVSFGMPRHGIMWAKGVGKGYKMNGGIVVRTGGGPVLRKPADWFNSVINRRLPALADIATDNVATAAVNTSNVLIK